MVGVVARVQLFLLKKSPVLPLSNSPKSWFSKGRVTDHFPIYSVSARVLGCGRNFFLNDAVMFNLNLAKAA